jgi:uncharacterized protein
MMRNFLRISTLVLLVIVLGSFGVANAQGGPGQSSSLPDTIRVTGQGTTFAAPNIAYISAGVETVNTDVTVAVEEANSTVEAIIASLTEFGITEDDVRTENFYIYREGSYPSDPAIPSNFRVSNALRVTVRNTEQVPQVLSAMLSAGANMVNGVQYDVADTAALKSEARSLALADARAVAEQLAAELGVTLGDVVTITEFPVYGASLYYGGGMGGGGGSASVSAPPIEAGNLAVSVQVEVTYAIVR